MVTDDDVGFNVLVFQADILGVIFCVQAAGKTKPCGCTGNGRDKFLASDGHVEDAPVVEFMYLVVTRMPGESYRKRLIRSLLLYVLGISSVN